MFSESSATIGLSSNLFARNGEWRNCSHPCLFYHIREVSWSPYWNASYTHRIGVPSHNAPVRKLIALTKG